jgi:hypothetical protein
MVLSVGLPEGFTPRLLRPADGNSSCDTVIPLSARDGRLVKEKQQQIDGRRSRQSKRVPTGSLPAGCSLQHVTG